VWQIACYVAGLLALGNDAYDSMLFGREHSAEVNNGDMNVALTVNGPSGVLTAISALAVRCALVLLPPQENASLSATQLQIQKKIFPRILWPKGLECSNYVLRERCKWRHSIERV
jgi:hypothetical protein